jgi:anti-anti-sigma factor
VSDDHDVAQTTGGACPSAAAVSRSSAGWAVVTLPGEIDVSNAGQVRSELLAAIDAGHSVVVADMSLTTFCDCAGVSALLAAGSHAARSAAELRIAARARPVLRTFDLTGLPLALRVHPTSSAALSEARSATTRQDTEAGSATTRQDIEAVLTPLSRRRRTEPGESVPQPDRQRCP